MNYALSLSSVIFSGLKVLVYVNDVSLIINQSFRNQKSVKDAGVSTLCQGPSFICASFDKITKLYYTK